MNYSALISSSMRTVARVIPFIALNCFATPPPLGGGPLPPAMQERVLDNPEAFMFKRSLTQVTQRALAAREIARMPRVAPLGIEAQQDAILRALGLPQDLAAAQVVSGSRDIPVIAIRFAEQPNVPYPAADLQRQLFDGPWPSGTLRDYYREISGGELDVSGTVASWIPATHDSTYYEGADYFDQRTGRMEFCYGFCSNGRLGELLLEALNAPSNAGINWGRYDNDGPDGRANSGDDDGYVDFVAFVHAERGGECKGAENRNIWSHRWNLSGYSADGATFRTNSQKAGGGFIMIDDYVIQPGLACDGQKMIEIGVFAHEFGHAFGLPDLYDNDGSSAGLGNWCLMASGSWGGDNNSPETPTHMSPWAKDFLGWLDLREIAADGPVLLNDIHASRSAAKVAISQNMYYILANAQRQGFDSKLPSSGLQVWKINDSVIERTLRNNKVNDDENNRGVELIEADGNRSLNDPEQRGQAGDIYPGTSSNRRLDVSSVPASVGRVALCNISDASNAMSATLFVTKNNCSGAPANLQSNAGELNNAEATTLLGLNDLADGTQVRLEGTLENLGTSFFRARDRRIALVTADGLAVDVTVSAPVASREPQRGDAPPSLSTLLGRKVVIDGTLERLPTENGERFRVRANEVAVVE